MGDKKKILVVDDEPEIRQMLRSFFELMGYSVKEASGGREALKMVKSEPVDLILSDVRMPQGTGVELLENIAKEFKPLPAFIFMSGFTDVNLQKTREMGAKDFVEKPFNLSSMLDLVQKYI